MTFEEFKVAYQPLATKWPKEFAVQAVREAMFKETQSFQLEWVTKLVSQIILSNNAHFNILAAIEKEKRLRGFERTNNDNAEEWERLRKNSTEHGFQSELDKRGASTLWEAIEKEKKGGL